MARFWCILVALLACGTAMEAAAKGGSPSVSGKAVGAESAAALRERGTVGLDHALADYDELQAKIAGLQEESNRLSVAGYDDNKQAILAIDRRIADVDRRITAINATIDQIGGQRGCSVSRLYWYADLSEAKVEAARTGRPILSLRMLGNLTDEYSCANSRFFRTALYSNKEISEYLRGNYILHWQSVRPVPRVTIDFGDGRKLERTLTGNSAHYVLSSSGQPLDVLPGLYGPQAFREWLDRMRQLHTEYAATEPAQRAEKLAAFHRQRRADVYRGWARDVERLGEKQANFVVARIDRAIESDTAAGNDAPLAAAVSRMAEGKNQAESPLLRFAHFSGPWIEHGMDEDMWQGIANLHRLDVKLDEASVAVMGREFPRAAFAGKLAIFKSAQESPVLRMVRAFEASMTLDTVRNEYLLHRRIHERFADDKTPPADVDSLNEWVYAELFLTPSNDPWLGLAPRDVYTALDSDGRTEPAAQAAGRPGG